MDLLSGRGYYCTQKMIFCIQCGAKNPPDASFCLQCGTPIYRIGRSARTARTGRLRRKWKLPVGICVVLLLGLILFVTINRSPSVQTSKAESSEGRNTSEPQVAAPAFDSATLTIVATNDNGKAINQGSGFILTSDGLAGSNYHVLNGALSATAECCNGRKFLVASIEGVDKQNDLIVFQLVDAGTSLKPTSLPYVRLGSWKDASVGDKVYAVGSPEGLVNTVSDGILSAVRESNSMHFLQITAPISPGSSGGPVFNALGQMIGIATFQLKEGQNLNFAIAADHIQPLLNQHRQLSLAEFQGLVREKKEGAPTNEDQSEQPITGELVGVVHNETEDISADMALLIKEEEGDLSGCMIVVKPLFGSGPLSGFVNSTGLSFTVTSDLGTIVFSGNRRGPELTGNYEVDRKDGVVQHGTFTVRRRRSSKAYRNLQLSDCPTDDEVNRGVSGSDPQ